MICALRTDWSGRTRDGYIELSKKAKGKELYTNVIHHEYAHNYITKKLGGKQVWDFMDNPSLSEYYLRSFDEFLTETTAKKKISGHVMTDLEEYASSKTDFIFFYTNQIKKKNPNVLVELMAYSKLYSPNKYDMMKGYLKEVSSETSNRIIDLSDKYVDNKGLIVSSNKRKILTSIQNDYLDLIASIGDKSG